MARIVGAGWARSYAAMYSCHVWMAETKYPRTQGHFFCFQRDLELLRDLHDSDGEEYEAKQEDFESEPIKREDVS